MTEQYYRAWEISLSIPAPLLLLFILYTVITFISFADTSNWTEEQTLKNKITVES